MGRSVPGVRSPACTGITVWQLPHRQIWWEPRWRTDWQPRCRSRRISTRAVTALVYPPRHRSVQCVRRGGAFVCWGLISGVGVAFGAADREPEQIAEAATVTSGDECLVEDAVFTNCWHGAKAKNAEKGVQVWTWTCS